jgi:membrane peptidoglycan carboxypeptidase
VKKRTWKSILWLSGGGLLVLGALGVWFVLWILSGLPSVENIDRRQVSQSTKIYDREGTTLLYEISGGQKRTVIPFEEIPQTLKDAVVSIEDEKFYEEAGVSIRGIFRAAFANLVAGEVVQGGSTITQQLARNAFLTLDQTFLRKIREAFLAIQLDRRLTKNQVLGLYLNEIPFGPTVYGVEAASQAFFGKPAKELQLHEAALIASLAQRPSYFSPYGYHVDELMARKNYVLDQMQKLGYISPAEADSAKRADIVFVPQSIGSIRAPHFSLMVKAYLEDKYGDEDLTQSGYKVITTLDWKLQEIAEKAVEEGAKNNEARYKGRNAALVAEDPKTGQILALVGSRDYFDDSIRGNYSVATQALRQPGSALKPFIYLTAFEKGYGPQTILFDVKTEFDTRGGNESYAPENFDNIFRGPISLQSALAQSLNVIAVKTLYLAGMDASLETLKNFGVSTLTDRDRYSLTLVLGGGVLRMRSQVRRDAPRPLPDWHAERSQHPGRGQPAQAQHAPVPAVP